MRRGCLFLCQTQIWSLTKRVLVEYLQAGRTLLAKQWVEERACCSKEPSGSRSCIKIYQHQVLCSWGWALGPCKPLPSLPVELSQQLPPALLPHMPEVTMPTKCSGKLYSCLLHWFCQKALQSPSTLILHPTLWNNTQWSDCMFVKFRELKAYQK